MNGNTHHTLVGGQVLIGVHSKDECSGKYCPIHNFSNHHMVNWEQNWRPDLRMIERICIHEIGHPDPDDPSTNRVHGCDGCCKAPK